MSEQPRDEGPRGFGPAFQAVANGAAHVEASEKLQELLSTCSRLAKESNGTASGELMIKLKVSVDAFDVAGVGYVVSSSLPQRKRPKSTMWVTKGGNLTPESPRQTSLPLAAVPRPTEENTLGDRSGAEEVV